MAKEQVFISYKSEEQTDALWVKSALEAQGITCWMAPMSITGGANYAEEIAEAIKNCSVFVLMLTANAQASPWISKELDRAIHNGKRVMPFVLDKSPLIDSFDFYLSNVQCYYAFQNKAAELDRMLQDIRFELGIPEPSEPEPVKKPAEKPVEKTAKKPVKRSATKAPVTAMSFLKKFGKLWLIIFSAIGISCVILLWTIISHSGHSDAIYITFAGEEFAETVLTIEVRDQSITAQDMQNLKQFKDLCFLRLHNCTIEAENLRDFSSIPLSDLRLSNCSLNNSQLQTINFETLTELSTLDLSNNPQLTDLSAITPVSDTVTTLRIGGTGVKDINILEDFTKVTDLSVENLKLTTLKPLRTTVYLTNLIADGNQLTDLNGLENTTILETVSLKDNQLKEVAYLSNSAATLKKLYLDRNQLTDLSCLADCTNMTEFSADHNQLTSMDWVRKWTQLYQISVADNQIQFITSPLNSNKLAFVDLSGNQLRTFKDFVFATDRSITLDLSDNQLTYIALPESRKFKLLSLHGNPLKNLDNTSGSSGTTMSIDFFDSMDAAAVKEISFSNIYIIDCPLNRVVELEQASFKVTLLKRSEIAEQLPDPEFSEY